MAGRTKSDIITVVRSYNVTPEQDKFLEVEKERLKREKGDLTISKAHVVRAAIDYYMAAK